MKAASDTLWGPIRDWLPAYGASNDHVTKSACPKLDTGKSTRLSSNSLPKEKGLDPSLSREYWSFIGRGGCGLHISHLVVPVLNSRQEEKFRSGSQMGQLDVLV